MNKILSFLLSIILVLAIVFCSSCQLAFPDTNSSQGIEGGENVNNDDSSNNGSNQDGTQEDDLNDTNKDDSSDDESETVTENPALTKPTLNLSQLPEFDEKGYAVINNNQPYFTKNQIVTQSYEYYSELDTLGRCGLAVACLGKDLIPSGSRSDKLPDPTGWHSKAIYERSHLIAYALAGEEANRQNLITGTYDLNGIMQEFESLVLDYIKETNNHVMYRVDPIFEGNDLICKGVQMEAYSIEDNGEGVCFNIFIYNVQDDVEIDYSTGDYKVPESQYTYIVHKTKHKIHKTTCNAVHDMSEKNKEGTTLTLEELVEELTRLYGDNWSYCGTCKPQNG